MNDSILRGIIGDPASRNQEMTEYGDYVRERAQEQGYSKSQDEELAAKKKMVKGLKTYDRPKSPKLEAPTPPKALTAESKRESMGTALNIADPTGEKFPAQRADLTAGPSVAAKTGKSLKSLGANILAGIAYGKSAKNIEPYNPLEKKEARVVDVSSPTDKIKRITAQKELLIAERELGKERAKERFEKSFAGKITGVIQSPGLKGFGMRVSENIGGGLGGSIVGSFQDPGATRKYNAALSQKQAYVYYLKKQYKTNDWNDVLARLTPTQQSRLEQLDQRIINAQQAASTTGFGGRGGGLTALMGSTRPTNIGRFTQIKPVGNYGGYAPESLARLGVQQTIVGESPINKIRAMGLGVGTDTQEKLGIRMPGQVPFSNKIQMNIKAGRITELLGKKPTPIPAADIKSRMRRIW